MLKRVDYFRKIKIDKYNELDEKTKRKLDLFYNVDHKQHQLFEIKKIKRDIQTGDIFVVSPREGIYFYGRVLEGNIEREDKDCFFHGNHFIVIFKCKTYEINMDNYKPDYNDLLVNPCVIASEYWYKGYFYTIANIPLTEYEKNLDIGLYHSLWNKYYLPNGTELKHKPKIFGNYGFTTIIGVSSKINYELILKPELVDYKELDFKLDNYISHFKNVHTVFISVYADHETTLRLGDKISLIDEKAHMNGYNWGVLIMSYLRNKYPKYVEDLVVKTVAGKFECYYEKKDIKKSNELIEIIKGLIENEEETIKYIKTHEIEWIDKDTKILLEE